MLQVIRLADGTGSRCVWTLKVLMVRPSHNVAPACFQSKPPSPRLLMMMMMSAGLSPALSPEGTSFVSAHVLTGAFVVSVAMRSPAPPGLWRFSVCLMLPNHV